MSKAQDVEDRRGGKALTAKELEVLSEALEIFEGQFDEEYEAVAEVFDYDDEYVDIFVKFEVEDGSNDEQMAVERSRLSDGSSAKEIASAIN